MNGVIPAEVQTLLTLAIAGVMVMSMIYVSITIPVKWIFRIRISWASAIASLSMVWVSKILVIAPILLVIPQDALENRWISGLFMMLMVLLYCLFLFAFQPDNMQTITLKNLKETSLRKNAYLLDFNKKQWIKANKDKNADLVAKFDVEIAKLQDERKRLKYEFSKFKWLYNLFKQKKEAVQPSAE